MRMQIGVATVENSTEFPQKKLEIETPHGGAWMAQLVEHLTLDFGSGHDLTICEIESCIGLSLTAWSLLGILSLISLCPSPNLCTLSLSQK